MKRSLLKIVLIFWVSQAWAQGFEIDPNQWTSGHIVLINGDSLAGSVFYHKEKQALYFEGEQEMRVFKAAKVLKFDYYDSAKSTRRSFISIFFRKTETSAPKPEFLEVIREFGDYVMLSRFSSRKVTIPRNKYTSPQIITQLVEHWYLLDNSGARNLYFSFMHRDLFGPKVEFFNAALYKKITEPFRKEIDDFAVANKLNFQKPLDNVKLLDYAEELNRALR